MTATFGFDTTASVADANAGGAAVDRYGVPAFWVRSFSPCSTAPPLDVTRARATEECRAVWDSGARHLVPAMGSSPRVGGSRAMGIADAMTFCHAIRNVYNWVAPLAIPASEVVYAYLVQPPGYDLSLAYWQGWAGFVHSFPLAGCHPLYPALRCDPAGPDANGRTVNRAGAPDCWAVWATQPQPAAIDGPWAPNRCADPFPASLLWQVAPEGDGDVGVSRVAPDRRVLGAMLILLDRP